VEVKLTPLLSLEDARTRACAFERACARTFDFVTHLSHTGLTHTLLAYTLTICLFRYDNKCFTLPQIVFFAKPIVIL